MTGKPDGWLRGAAPVQPVVKAEPKPAAAPVKVGPDPDYRVTGADLEAIHGRQAERALEDQMRGEMAFAHFLGQAPSLVAAMQKLKQEGRG